jgi:hypothetical protein
MSVCLHDEWRVFGSCYVFLELRQALWPFFEGSFAAVIFHFAREMYVFPLVDA